MNNDFQHFLIPLVSSPIDFTFFSIHHYLKVEIKQTSKQSNNNEKIKNDI